MFGPTVQSPLETAGLFLLTSIVLFILIFRRVKDLLATFLSVRPLSILDFKRGNIARKTKGELKLFWKMVWLLLRSSLKSQNHPGIMEHQVGRDVIWSSLSRQEHSPEETGPAACPNLTGVRCWGTNHSPAEIIPEADYSHGQKSSSCLQVNLYPLLPLGNPSSFPVTRESPPSLQPRFNYWNAVRAPLSRLCSGRGNPCQPLLTWQLAQTFALLCGPSLDLSSRSSAGLSQPSVPGVPWPTLSRAGSWRLGLCWCCPRCSCTLLASFAIAARVHSSGTCCPLGHWQTFSGYTWSHDPDHLWRY